MSAGPKDTYVLIHGGNMSTDTWNKLAGRNDYPPGGRLAGKVWDRIIPALKVHGGRVYSPDLKDEHITNLTGHIEQICTLITRNDLNDIKLVGHSYGGMVITGVAARMPERIRCLVYLDAALPDPGQSLFDLFASSSCDPLSFSGLEAAQAYVEKVQFDPMKIEPIPKTYIFCTESEFAQVTGIARKKIAAHGDGWTYIEIPSSHVPMASMPEQFTQILQNAAEKNI
jgi:pimeloyl-ACP methyl ester carboxylesterase